MLAALAAPALGLLADFAFRSGRTTAYILGVAFACVALWVFSSALWQKPALQLFIAGGGIVLFVAWTVAWTAHPARRLGARRRDRPRARPRRRPHRAHGGERRRRAISAMGLGAACGGFLMVQMLFSRRVDAGLVFCLAVGVQGALVAVGALLLGRFGWLELAILALVPLAARLPVPPRWPVWTQVVLASLYTLACGGAAVAVRFV